MTIKHGVRVRIKTHVEMGMKSSAYLFDSHENAYLYVDTRGQLPGTWRLCPKAELDGSQAAMRMFNEKHLYHITVPECCFVVEPETRVGTPAQRERLLKILNQFTSFGVTEIDDVIKLLQMCEGLDLERLLTVVSLIHKNDGMHKKD